MRYWWIAALIVIVAGGGVLWAHERTVRAAAPSAAIQTAPVKRGNIVATMTAAGTVQAWNEAVVRVGVGVNGTLQPFDWNVSQQVMQGEVLFTLVNPQQQQQTATDEANLQEAQLQLQQMQAATADTAPQQAALTNAQLQVSQAQSAYGQAQADLQAEQQVTAPIGGTVAVIDAANGQSVASGVPIISIVQTANLLAQLAVPQAQLAGIAAGQPALVFVNGTNYPAQVQSVTPAPGTVYEGQPSYPVTLDLTNPGALLPGMPVTASIETDQQTQIWATDLAGTLAPTAAVDAVSQTAGTVTALAVQVGQTVAAEQVLGQVDSTALQNAVQLAQENLNQAQGALAAIQANQAATAAAGPYNIQQQDIEIGQLQDAVGSDKTLEAGLVVRSPVTGVISGVQAVAGEPVGPGTPLLTIGDYSKLLVTFPLDQLFVNRVKVGETATVTATSAPGKNIKGSLYLLAPEGTDVNGVANFQAEVEIPRPTPELRPGMAVTVTIVLGQAKGVLTVPLQALHTNAAGKTFAVVVTTGASGISTTDVPVKVGLQNTLDAHVTGNLRAGQQVLTSSLSSLTKVGSLNLRGRTIGHKAQVTHRAPVNSRR